jgi:hypothetical protein
MSLNYTPLRHKIAERGFWVGQAVALIGCALLAVLNVTVGAEWPQWVIFAGVAVSVASSVLSALTKPEPRRSAQHGEPT